MQHRLKLLSLVSTTLLFSLASFPILTETLNSDVLAQTPTTETSPLPASPFPSLSPIEPLPEMLVPSLSTIPIFYPNNIYPNNSPLRPLTSNRSGSLLSIEIPCQAQVENIQQKLQACQQFLAIHRQIGDRIGESVTLSNIALIYRELGNYDRALNFYQQALAIQTAIGSRASEAATLNNIGLTYHEVGEYSQALNFYQQALAIHKEIGNRVSEGRTLNNLAELYSQLGQYSQAREFYQQALAVIKVTKDTTNLGNTLHNIGLLHQKLNQFPQALEYYQQALAIRKNINDRTGEGTTLSNIALVYDNLGQHSQALDSLKQALAILTEVGNRVGVGNALDSMGTVYKSLGDYTSALEYYQQALVILKEIGNRGLERVTLSNIASALESQNQPELAIVFYKQSVNVTEAIRKNLRSLPREQQESYTKTVADTYRTLADILLKQNRILEAQQVIDLLKIQELNDYLGNVRGNEQTSQGVELLPQEQKLTADYAAIQNRAIQLGKELAELRKIPEANRTPAQATRIAEIVKAQEAIAAEFNAFIRSPEVQASIAAQSPIVRDGSISLRRLKNIQDNLQRLGKGAVLLYPLILEDRLELIITTADSPPIRRTVSVERSELNRAIVEFRSALQNPDADAKIPAQKLYKWLIKPLENDLIQAEAQTLIYAPDEQLRYIPLAALHDGKQWLVERFRINYITADSLTDFNTQPPDKPQVLAAGFTKGSYTFRIGDREFFFSGLPFAAREVDNLVTIFPNSLKLLDGEFSRNATVPRLNDYNIVHLATHAAFVVGQPNDSFILFGNGDRVTLPDVENWRLTNVDLVVLSACETGIGGKLGNGEEILGFGYLIQEAGAKAAIASLWSVSDGGTQALMDAFYTALSSSKTVGTKTNITKAEALRQAQIELITRNYSAVGQHRGIGIQGRTRNNLPLQISDRLNHPYYWSSFILIGNGL